MYISYETNSFRKVQDGEWPLISKMREKEEEDLHTYL